MTIMRYPEGHKDTARQRIVAAASAALRQGGLDGVSIPRLMKAAGLTHGAFYAHFASRDVLVAAAVDAAQEATIARVFDASGSLSELLDRYLSPWHLAHPDQGCVVAALGTEGARQPTPVRQAFARAARRLLHAVDRKLHPAPEAAPSDEALRLAATLVGAVVLARLVDDPELAARLLHAAHVPTAAPPAPTAPPLQPLPRG
jgi:TetR/AcrR family transcriptional repressor of nem operon